MEQPELIRDHFPDAKLIAIFRHPLDRAISAWNANERLSEQEDDPRHRDLQTKCGGLEGWVEHNAKRFVVLAKRLVKICKGPPILLLRYEKVAVERQQSLRRIFDFLEVQTEADTLKPSPRPPASSACARRQAIPPS